MIRFLSVVEAWPKERVEVSVCSAAAYFERARGNPDRSGWPEVDASTTWSNELQEDVDLFRYIFVQDCASAPRLSRLRSKCGN